MAAAEAKKAYTDRVSGKRKDGIHATIPELLTAVKRFEVAKRAELEAGQTELRYIKHPATWLNGGGRHLGLQKRNNP